MGIVAGVLTKLRYQQRIAVIDWGQLENLFTDCSAQANERRARALASLAADRASGGRPPNGHLVDEAMRLLARSYSLPSVSLAQLAASAGVTCGHLGRVLRLQIGGAVRVEYIPDGVDSASWMSSSTTPSTTRASLGIADDAVVCVCAGRVEPGKDQHRALDIVECISRERGAVVILAGDSGMDGAYAQSVQDRVTMYGHQRARWLPFVRDMADLYRLADVVLVPSRDEALGMVGIEAMAAGKLLAANRSSGYVELIRDGMDGVLFSPRDSAEAISRAIVAVLDDVSTRESVQRSARARARETFDASLSAERLGRLWQELSSRRRETHLTGSRSCN